MNQLTMFEPSGSELAKLASISFELADRNLRKCELMTMRGLHSISNIFMQAMADHLQNAFTFEMAAQFEVEAGLL